MSQPKCWIIASKDSSSRHYTSSQQNLKSTMSAADKWQWSVDIWPAVDGWKVTLQTWQGIGVELLDRGAIVKRPGAQGCFHSHFGIWLWCCQQQSSAVILEHDAEIRGPWPEDLDLDCCVWKLYRPDGRGDRVNEITGLWSPGSWAYSVTPKFAQRLIEFSRAHGAQALDKQLGLSVVPWQYWHQDLVKHRPRTCSTTSPKDPRLC